MNTYPNLIPDLKSGKEQPEYDDGRLLIVNCKPRVTLIPEIKSEPLDSVLGAWVWWCQATDHTVWPIRICVTFKVTKSLGEKGTRNGLENGWWMRTPSDSWFEEPTRAFWVWYLMVGYLLLVDWKPRVNVKTTNESANCWPSNVSSCAYPGLCLILRNWEWQHKVHRQSLIG